MAFSIQPALHAVEKGNYAWLMKQPAASLLEWRSRDRGATILHHLVRHGKPNADVLDWMLANGIEIDVEDKKGASALLHLFERPESDSLQWMKILVSRGARIDKHDHEYATTLSNAAIQRSWSCVHYALSQGAPRWIKGSPWECSLEGQIAAGTHQNQNDAISALISINRAFPATQDDHTRGLFMSLQHGHWVLAQFHMDQGANSKTLAPTGSTALHMAALGCSIGNATQKEDDAMVMKLASLGVDPHVINEMGVKCEAYIQNTPALLEQFKRAVVLGSAHYLDGLVQKPSGRGRSRRM